MTDESNNKVPVKSAEEEIHIPKERISALIGKSGDVRRSIERKSKTKIIIDAEEGIITIKSKDQFNLWICKKVIEAIGRGFNPEIAQKLFKEGTIYELIDIRDFAGSSKKKLIRLRGRIIGRAGKSKSLLQKYTNTDISIYGKTIGIIGKPENVELARKAIEMLLSGAKHSTAYNFIRNAGELHG